MGNINWSLNASFLFKDIVSTFERILKFLEKDLTGHIRWLTTY